MPRPEVLRRFSGARGSSTAAGSNPSPSSRIEITSVSATTSISRWTCLEGSWRFPCLMALATASRTAIRIQWRVSSSISRPSMSRPHRCCTISMFSKRLDSDIRIGPALGDGRGAFIHELRKPGGSYRKGAAERNRGGAVLPSAMLRGRRLRAAGIVLAAAGLVGFTDLLPNKLAEVSRQVEEVRGRRFQRAVPASEIDAAEARRVLRAKILEGLPAPPDEAFRSLAAIGLIEDSPKLLDSLLDFYSSQVVAFYDPDPRRFFVVKGAEGLAGADSEDLARGLIFSHELTHALQDENLRLADRVKALREDGDRSLALQCLLEGEATLVMIRVALQEIPGAGESAEDEMAPLLTAGALERGAVSADVPDFFVDQLFFPYSDGTAFVRAAVKESGWAEIDRLWKNPPESTSEILHGMPYPPPASKLLPSSVASLAPGQRLSYTDTLGEWTIRFLLGRALPEEEAAAAATG